MAVGPLPAALIGIAVATATGALTGAVTVGWRIPSFIVSLGVLEPRAASHTS